MTWTIYLLATLDDLRSTFTGLAWVSGAMLTLVIFAMVPRFMELGLNFDKDAANAKAIWAQHIRAGKIASAFLAVFMVLSALIPTRRSLIEAYAITEGAKIITADNGKKMAEEVGKRFDTFLNMLDKKWADAKP